MVTPEKLIRKSLKGDANAQRQLVERYGPKLLVVCKRYVSKGLDSYDVFQEAWIKIFAALDRFDPEKGEFEGWIYRITVNEALKMIRNNLKHDYKEDVEDPVVQSDVVGTENIFSELGYQELLQLIDNLPEWQRLVFNLSVIEGYNHTEIADKIGISTSTSRSQLTRAKQKLRQMTQQLYEEST